jgi:hypothetical protein
MAKRLEDLTDYDFRNLFTEANLWTQTDLVYICWRDNKCVTVMSTAHLGQQSNASKMPLVFLLLQMYLSHQRVQ